MEMLLVESLTGTVLCNFSRFSFGRRGAKAEGEGDLF